MAQVTFGLFDWIDRGKAPLYQLYEERLQLLEAADAAGFFGYHLAEHHDSPLGMAPSPALFLTAAAQRTRRIRLGPLVYLLPLYHPLRLIEEVCMLDHLSGGRLDLGVGRGVSPYELGYFGVDAADSRAIFNEALAVLVAGLTHTRLTFEGEHYQVPNLGPATMGLGKPLKSITHPRRADLPIFLGAEGPKNVAMAAEIADGWLPIFLSPELDEHYRECLAEGFARPGARRTADEFEVASVVSVVIDDDVEKAADIVRQSLGFYIGGMGAREVNFHANLFARMGYGDEVEEIQDLFLAGRKDEAIKRVPLQLVEDVALVGPEDKIREELDGKWRKTALTTMLVSGSPPDLRKIADLVRG